MIVQLTKIKKKKRVGEDVQNVHLQQIIVKLKIKNCLKTEQKNFFQIFTVVDNERHKTKLFHLVMFLQ